MRARCAKLLTRTARSFANCRRMKAAARHSQARDAEAAAQRHQAEREEQGRFLNQPGSDADFDHWSKAAHWTLDEALSLSFGKAPEHVTWERVKKYVGVSPFAFQYGRRRDLALRAVQWAQLYDPVLPGIFLAWARRNGLLLPENLEAARNQPRYQSRRLAIAIRRIRHFHETTACAVPGATANKGRVD